jgi:hypothetical protein
MHRHALVEQVPADRLRHLGVERRHHLRQLLQHRHREPAVGQVLRHLQPDEPAANHECTLRPTLRDPAPDADAVGDRAHGEDARKVDARHGRADRRSPGRKYERVVALLALDAGVQVRDGDRAARAVDRGHLVARLHGDVEPVPEEIAGGDQQVPLLGDDVADEVWQAAVGERDVGAAIEHHDLRRLIQAPQPRRARRPARHPADDEHPLAHEVPQAGDVPGPAPGTAEPRGSEIPARATVLPDSRNPQVPSV